MIKIMSIHPKHVMNFGMHSLLTLYESLIVFANKLSADMYVCIVYLF